MTNESHKQYIRLPNEVAIKKLEDLINIELDTLDTFLKLATAVKKDLEKLDIDQDIKQSIISAYNQKVSEYIYNVHINDIVQYASLLAYAIVLDSRNKLYAYEDNFGNMQITYKPYLIEKTDK